MNVECVWEHNGNDSLLHAGSHPGAFTRGETREIALGKMENEIRAYLRWKNEPCDAPIQIRVTQEWPSTLDICDADSDAIFDEEKMPLSLEAYERMKALALKSAQDFLMLYESIPDRHTSILTPKNTFLGPKPLTAFEMYRHTRDVNSYYFGEIDVDADHEGTIYECRKRGFERLEQRENYWHNSVILGSYDEQWSLRKMLRRFLWHDRIHAKAMYRMAKKTFPQRDIPDIFRFEK